MLLVSEILPDAHLSCIELIKIVSTSFTYLKSKLLFAVTYQCFMSYLSTILHPHQTVRNYKKQKLEVRKLKANFQSSKCSGPWRYYIHQHPNLYLHCAFEGHQLHCVKEVVGQRITDISSYGTAIRNMFHSSAYIFQCNCLLLM